MSSFNIFPRSTDNGIVDPCSDEAPRQSSARASQRITALGEMTAGLAHDFRNILATIEAGISLAERNFDDRAMATAALGAAHEGIRRGSQLASQLLLFARPEKPNDHPEHVNDLLGGLLTFLKYGAGADIRVILDLTPELPQCLIDPPQFNAAILNLVINARDAMPDGGEIRIQTEECHQATRDAGALPRRWVRVRVSDQGCGMSPEVARNIFDPYFTTKGEAGTGLGVPQVAAFMRSSGGTVCLQTEPGLGTAFDLLFPPADNSEPAKSSTWRQLDRWENEGGQSAPAAPHFSRQSTIECSPDRPLSAIGEASGPNTGSPDADLSGT